MKFKKYFLLYFLAMMVSIACKTSPVRGLTHAMKMDTDVYVVGTVMAINGNLVAAYWKNGIAHKLSDSTLNCYGEGVAVNGNEVYVTGIYAGNNMTAACWKNGVETKLTKGIQQSEAYGIVVNNHNVFIAGTIYDANKHHAVYWKNGIPTNLTPNEKASAGYAIAVNGTHVYVTGNTGSIINLACYWKDGLLITLNVIATGSANSILFNDEDIYIGGYISSNQYPKAVYWHNGKATYLTDGSSRAQIYGVAIKDDNVYAAGYTTAPNDYTLPTYWKNGKATSFTDDGTANSEMRAVALVGDDVYLVGCPHIKGYYKTVYWKNGVANALAGGVNATGIVVVPHPHN